MATIKNPWIGYLDRAYQQIKDSLLNRLVTSNPEITDHSSSNILIIILDMFSGIGEMLNYYIDNMAREAFILSARRFASMVKLVKILDYRIKAANASSVDIFFEFGGDALTSSGQIPTGTILKTSNNIQFVTVADLNLITGDEDGIIGAKQIEIVVNEALGTTDGTSNQAFSIGTLYVDGSSVVRVDGVTYDRVNSLGLSGATDKHYIVDIHEDGIAYVTFGNGTNGIIPPTAKPVTADFYETSGSDGNVDSNTITVIVSTLTLPGITTITSTNPLASSGGSNYEDIESIRVNAPLSIRTLDRAVTRQDYIDISRLAPGVAKSTVNFNCGKDVDIYIVPSGGGIAQSPLLASVLAFMNLRKMITTFIHIQPSGETQLIIQLDVTAKFRMDKVLTYNDIIEALITYGALENQNINKKVRLSDIIALVDNLEKVDFLEVVGIGTRPYARPYNHINELIWNRQSLSTSTVRSEWRIEYTSSGLFNIIKNLSYITSIAVSTPWTDPEGELSLEFLPSSYTVGETWKFTSYPWGKDIVIDDFTIPRVYVGDLTINVIEQLTPPIV